MKQKVVTGVALISCLVAGSALWFASRGATGAPKPRVAAEPPALPENVPAAAPVAREGEIERGKHLVLTSGCHDCHTPFKPGPNGSYTETFAMMVPHVRN